MKGLRTVAAAVAAVLLSTSGLFAQELLGTKFPQTQTLERQTRGAVEAKGTQDTRGMASLGFFSTYLWRGFKLGDGVVFQPVVGVQSRGFGASIWTNYDENQNDLTETDVILTYTYPMDRFTFGFGYAFYNWNFEAGGPSLFFRGNTHEIFVSAAYEHPIITPKLTIYGDIDDGEGGFLTLSLSHVLDVARNVPYFNLPKETTLTIAALMSVNLDNELMGAGDDYTNFHHIEAAVAMNIPLTTTITFEPKIGFSTPLSNDAEDALKRASFDGDDDNIYAGAALTYRF
ncbi:MAG: hypothetical protein AB1805_08195 [Nitrospirota bacterium]